VADPGRVRALPRPAHASESDRLERMVPDHEFVVNHVRSDIRL
jgi:hypothetical protein